MFMVKIDDPGRTAFYFARAALIDRCVREAMADFNLLRNSARELAEVFVLYPDVEAGFIARVRFRFRRYTARENR